MAAVGISSYRALAARAGVSLWQVGRLRGKNKRQMRLEVLSQFADALQMPLILLLQELGLINQLNQLETSAQVADLSPERELIALRQEYVRLQEQVEQLREEARSQIEAEALQILESWLMQWPTVAKRAIANESLKAAKVLPFVRPVEQLMEAWGVEAIAPIDAEVEYDPQLHQLVGGTVDSGEKVRVTHSGHLYKGKLLHRAKVKAI